MASGWERYQFWLTTPLLPLVIDLDTNIYRVLEYIDNYLVSPSPYIRVAKKSDCSQLNLGRMVIRRNKVKVYFLWYRVVEHLVVGIVTILLKFTVVTWECRMVQYMQRKLLKAVVIGQWTVSTNIVDKFDGPCV